MHKLPEKDLSSILKTIQNIPLFSQNALRKITVTRLAGETNQNFLIQCDNKKTVLRCPRKTSNQFINRDNEALNYKICEALGITPKNLWRERDNNKKLTGTSLTSYIEYSRATKAEDLRDDWFLEKIANLLITIQTCKTNFAGVRDKNKMADSLKEYFYLCNPTQQNLLKNDYKIAQNLLSNLKDKRALVPSHIDLVLENILIQDQKIWLIDWEYSAMSSPFWDIAILCNSADLNQQEANALLGMVIEDIHDNDFQLLTDYRFIANTLSTCWTHIRLC